jgi:hypothetical protein
MEKVVDPVGLEVEGGAAVGLETLLLQDRQVERFDFKECFNVIGGEREGDNDDLFAALTPGEDVFAGLVGIGFDPLASSKFGLIGEFAERFGEELP